MSFLFKLALSLQYNKYCWLVYFITVDWLISEQLLMCEWAQFLLNVHFLLEHSTSCAVVCYPNPPPPRLCPGSWRPCVAHLDRAGVGLLWAGDRGVMWWSVVGGVRGAGRARLNTAIIPSTEWPLCAASTVRVWADRAGAAPCHNVLAVQCQQLICWKHNKICTV